MASNQDAMKSLNELRRVLHNPHVDETYKEHLLNVVEAAMSPSSDDKAVSEQELYGQLSAERAEQCARACLKYCGAYPAEHFNGLNDSVDRQNLAVALDNLQECAAMLLNLSGRVASTHTDSNKEALSDEVEVRLECKLCGNDLKTGHKFDCPYRNDAIMNEAERVAALYDGDDRQDIKTDVMNAFYKGVAFARAIRGEKS
jgi:hypothetical protein